MEHKPRSPPLYPQLRHHRLTQPQRRVVVDLYAAHHRIYPTLLHRTERHPPAFAKLMPCMLQIVQIVGIVDYPLRVHLIVPHLYRHLKHIPLPLLLPLLPPLILHPILHLFLYLILHLILHLFLYHSLSFFSIVKLQKICFTSKSTHLANFTQTSLSIEPLISQCPKQCLSLSQLNRRCIFKKNISKGTILPLPQHQNNQLMHCILFLRRHST